MVSFRNSQFQAILVGMVIADAVSQGQLPWGTRGAAALPLGSGSAMAQADWCQAIAAAFTAPAPNQMSEGPAIAADAFDHCGPTHRFASTAQHPRSVVTAARPRRRPPGDDLSDFLRLFTSQPAPRYGHLVCLRSAASDGPVRGSAAEPSDRTPRRFGDVVDCPRRLSAGRGPKLAGIAAPPRQRHLNGHPQCGLGRFAQPPDALSSLAPATESAATRLAPATLAPLDRKPVSALVGNPLATMVGAIFRPSRAIAPGGDSAPDLSLNPAFL
jgi:hypothetical protein